MGSHSPRTLAWIETVCFRDLAQFKALKLSGDLARDILETIPKLDRSQIIDIANKLKVDARRIKRHVEALGSLFLLQPIRPHSSGTGKDEWVLWDTGLAYIHGASLRSRLRTLCMNECLAQFEYSGKGLPRLFYFQSAKGARADLVVEANGKTNAYLLWEDATLGPYLSRTIDSVRRHLPDAGIFVVAPVTEAFKTTGAMVVPWTSLG